jgi:hypothetical protein
MDAVTVDIDPEPTLAESDMLMKFLADTSRTGETHSIRASPTKMSLACFSQTVEEQPPCRTLAVPS